MNLLETIVAPATPLGRSALAIVRIDGPQSSAILAALTGTALPPVRQASFSRLWADGELLDECVAVRFEAPHSFTGNDLVELTLHGNPVLVERVVAAAVATGARFAHAGEFTERAVLNGKLDLVQAESIADLISARTSFQAKLSLSNLEGHLSRTAEEIRLLLLDVIARTEAALDFADEGYSFIAADERAETLHQIARRLDRLAETFRRGRATAGGLSAAILGRPNAGKSTLLNRLVGSDRAIVTPIPGTTRDVVRETIEIGGLPVVLADTAGLRASDDVVEGIGIAKARQEASRADLVLYLVDAAGGVTEEDARELDALADPRGERVTLLLYTKTDLAAAPPGALAVSVAEGVGIEELLARLDGIVRERFAAPEGSLVNERQRGAVAEAAVAIGEALTSQSESREEQLILVDLYRAASAVGALTGAITRDDVLAEIFSRFCIGK